MKTATTTADRGASKPKLGLMGYWSVMKSSVHQISDSNLALISAGVAFFSMLSLFPALAALIAVLALISDPALVVSQLEDIKGLLPTDVYDILNQQAAICR